jgi:hypothetical protein
VLAVAVTVDFYGESDAEVEAPLVLSLEHQYSAVSMRALQCGGVRDAALARDAR